jgi:outer membrane protein TolC
MDRKNNKIQYFKKFILFTFCFIFVSGFTSLKLSAQELTFNQALEKMQLKNETLKASQSAVDKSKYDQKAAQGLYFPKIQMATKHTYLDEDLVIDLNDIRTVMGTLHGINPDSLPSFESKVQSSNFFNANINFTWMVFTGGKILAANRAADARVLENQEQLLYTKSILTTELAKRYYGYCLSLEAANVYKQVLHGIEQHLNQAIKLEKNGMLAQSERLHAQVAYADALRKYKKSIRKTKIIQAGLKNTLSSQETITPVSPLFMTKKILPLSDYLDSAGHKNHGLKQIAAKKEIADQAYNAQRSAHLPKVYFFGKYELYKDDLTLMEPEWAAGIGVNLSVFEGFSTKNKIIAAKKQKEQIRYYEAKAMRDIDTAVEIKYNELMTAIEQFEALEASMAFANENYRVQKRSFMAGMTSSLNAVDANLALSKVKIEKLNAVYEFDVALAQLLEVCGLSEKYEAYQNNDDVEVRF